MKTNLVAVLTLAICAFGVGCGDDAGSTGGAGTGGTGGSTGGTGGSNGLCQTAGVDVNVPATISEDTTLAAGCDYVLTEDTFVTGGTLTIEAGATVFGGANSALVVTQNGRIEAVGTAAAPIVFTPDLQAGVRQPGNWGGVVLLGNAPLSFGNSACDGTAGACVANIEGLAPTENGGLYGGNDASADCGTLRYVRIEFAGRTIGDDNELNGLTVGGCGSDTELSYIQVHRGEDDGIEFFGGTASVDHFVVSGPGDDGLDWDQGWSGTAETFVVHQFRGTSGDPRGIEGDNNQNDGDSMPRSNPTVSYGTIIGDPTNATIDRGVVLRRGTWGTVSNLIVADFPKAGIDIRNAESAAGWPADFSVEDSVFWNNNPDYEVEPTDGGDDDDDGGFDEAAALADAARGNDTNTDPGLGDTTGATNGGTPNYTASAVTTAGAFGNDASDWLAGWTSFPEN